MALRQHEADDVEPAERRPELRRLADGIIFELPHHAERCFDIEQVSERLFEHRLLTAEFKI